MKDYSKLHQLFWRPPLSNYQRILIISGPLDGAGTSRFIIKLVNALASGNIPVALLVCGHHPGFLFEELRTRGIQIEFLGYGDGWRGRITLWRKLLSRTKRNKPDVVHTMSGMVGVYAAFVSKIAGVPRIVMSQRNMGYWLNNTTHSTLRHFLYRIAIRQLCDIVLVNANAIQEQLIRAGLPKDRIRIIYNGITQHEESQIQIWRAQTRKLIDVNDETVIIGLVATLRRVKRIDRFLEIAYLLVTENKLRVPVKFVVVGDGPERQKLQQHVLRLNLNRYIVFLGNQPDALAIAAGFDIGVLTSASEGFPQAILEQMSLGVPTVAFKVGGISEVIEHNKTGFYCEEHDLNQFADYLVTLANNKVKRSMMGSAALDRVSKKFEIDRMIFAHLNAYGDTRSSSQKEIEQIK